MVDEHEAAHGNSLQGGVITLTSAGQEHHIARAHVVDIVFRTEEGAATGAQGGSWQSYRAADAGDARFMARIVTLAGGADGPYTVEVYGDAARWLREALREERDAREAGVLGVVR